MKKVIGILAGIFLLCLGTIARADFMGPSDIHVNDGTTYLFPGPEVHALTDPSTVTLMGSHNGVTIADVMLVLATPGDTDLSPATISGATPDSGTYMGDLTAGMEVYGDVLGYTGGNNSQSFTNFTMYYDKDVTNFDIWVYALNGVDLSQANPVTVDFESGPPGGTYVFAYGMGDDGKYYYTPFTESGLNVPEPSAMLLFGTGLIGLAGISRKRKKR